MNMDIAIPIDDNYILEIYKAFDHDINAISLATSLVKNISEIYRYIEPDHYNGELVIFKTFCNKDIFPSLKKEVLYDKNFLINNESGQILIQVRDDGTISLFEEKQNLSTLFESNEALFYFYKDREECFYANNKKITLKKWCDSASTYSLKYFELTEALENYKLKMARYSSCLILNKVWLDGNRIFFKSSGSGSNEPEIHIHESLENFLKSALRDIQVQVIREYSVSFTKSVDIRVHWGKANRSALIEVKWLGQSCSENGKFTTRYSTDRVKEGCVQLKEYLDLERKDTPNSITKGFLIVLDGRRKNIKEGMTKISRQDGMCFINNDLSIYYNKYVSDIFNFEKPIIMFVEPVCQ